MAFLRFGSDCDVYVYDRTDGDLVCAGCLIDGHFECLGIEEMMRHLRGHIMLGHRIPELLEVERAMRRELPREKACGHCGGTGRYDDGSRELPDCYPCEGTGSVRPS